MNVSRGRSSRKRGVICHGLSFGLMPGIGCCSAASERYRRRSWRRCGSRSGQWVRRRPGAARRKDHGHSLEYRGGSAGGSEFPNPGVSGAIRGGRLPAAVERWGISGCCSGFDETSQRPIGWIAQEWMIARKSARNGHRHTLVSRCSTGTPQGYYRYQGRISGTGSNTQPLISRRAGLGIA